MAKEPNRLEWQLEVNIRAWKDPAFKKRLLKNPQKALQELGCSSELSMKNVKIIEEKKDAPIIVLHPAPEKAESLSKDELRDISAGATFYDYC